MANLPIVLSLLGDMEHDLYEPVYDFGLGLHPHHIHRYHRPQRRQPDVYNSLLDYTLPLSLLASAARRNNEKRDRGAVGPVAPVGKDGFQVCMDVSQFKPNELNVKVVENCIVVEGKHEEREDEHGYIERHFVRRYTLPKGYEADKVASTLSSDGVLTVSVPKPQAIEDKSKERVIQIQQTGPAHLNVKENPKEEGGKEKDEGKSKL